MMVGMLFPSLGVVYLHTCSGRTTHGVPAYTAPDPETITEPYECRSDGRLDFCSRKNCQMRWKPPGTHHCSTCGICRLGFDHHCPWVSEAPVFDSFWTSLDPLPAGKLRHLWPHKTLLDLTRSDVCHRTPCQPASSPDLEEPRRSRAGSIPCGYLDNRCVVGSSIFLDSMWGPSGTLDRRNPAWLPQASCTTHARTVAKWLCYRATTYPRRNSRGRCSATLDIRHCA